jgi:hypothetical protein
MAEKTIGELIAAKKREIERHTKQLKQLEAALNGAPTYKARHLWWRLLPQLDWDELADHTDKPTFAMLVGIAGTLKAEIREMRADKLALAYYTPSSIAGNGLLYPGTPRLVLTTDKPALARKWGMNDAKGELLTAFEWPTK